MNITERLKQNAEKLGISVSHYDINGHLIYANPQSLPCFTELLQPPNRIKQSACLFDDVIIIQESEPISYDLDLLNLPASSSLNSILTDQKDRFCPNKKCLFTHPYFYLYYLMDITFYKLSLPAKFIVFVLSSTLTRLIDHRYFRISTI